MANDPQHSPVREGDLVAGKYRVGALLGLGGMGVVVAAVHEDLGKEVAIKFLLPSARLADGAVERFVREARVVARLKSEHVAKVLDVGSLPDGVPYIVMERLVGEDLADLLHRSGPLPVHLAVGLVLQTCAALAEAHAAGLVHRDIKPRNLFLTTRVDGTPLVKVLDFGVSKSSREGDLSITTQNSVLGSPMYMAPEQLQSATNVDARADIYALGLVMFELLTGRLPFVAETFTELVLKVAQDAPPVPRALKPDIPEGLSTMVLRCLEKDPANRFATVAVLAACLESYGPIEMRGVAERVSAVMRHASMPPMGELLSSPGMERVSRPAPRGSFPPGIGGDATWGRTTQRMEATPRPTKPWALLAGGVGVSVLVGVVALVAPSARQKSAAAMTPVAASDDGPSGPAGSSAPKAPAALSDGTSAPAVESAAAATESAVPVIASAPSAPAAPRAAPARPAPARSRSSGGRAAGKPSRPDTEALVPDENGFYRQDQRALR